jgi:hypothetical protein
MSKKKFKIFVTDGENIWDVFFVINENKGDFYYNIIFPGLKSKYSRHKSGKTHHKGSFNDKIIDQNLGIRQKLEIFNGSEFLGGFCLITELFTYLEKENFKSKKFNGGLLIDSRHYSGYFRISAFLIEPTKISELKEMSSFYENSQILILTETLPWVVLFVNGPINE